MQEVNTPQTFGTVEIDYPWPGFGVEHIYPTMTVEEILAMSPSISKLFADDCVVWIWCGNKNTTLAHRVLTSLGLRYSGSMLTWVKPRLGRGSPLRNMTEHALVGIKGKPEIKFRSQGTWLFAPVQDSGHKPEEFKELARRLSPGPYLELFARRPYPGWVTWGNELSASQLIIPGYPVPSDARHRSGEAE